MNLKTEAVREERLEHQLHCLRRCFRGRLGGNFESVRVEPAWPALHLHGVNAIGEADQIHHTGGAHIEPAPAKDPTSHVWIRDVRAHVNVGQIKGRRRIGGLAENRCGNKDDDTSSYQSSQHYSTSC
jgi:hypothetical protein